MTNLKNYTTAQMNQLGNPCFPVENVLDVNGSWNLLNVLDAPLPTFDNKMWAYFRCFELAYDVKIQVLEEIARYHEDKEFITAKSTDIDAAMAIEDRSEKIEALLKIAICGTPKSAEEIAVHIDAIKIIITNAQRSNTIYDEGET